MKFNCRFTQEKFLDEVDELCLSCKFVCCNILKFNIE